MTALLPPRERATPERRPSPGRPPASADRPRPRPPSTPTVPAVPAAGETATAPARPGFLRRVRSAGRQGLRSLPSPSALLTGLTQAPGWVAVVLLAEAVVAADVRVPWLRPLAGFVALIGIPVLVLTRRAFAGVQERLVGFLYACGATVLGIIVVALALNTALPHLGVPRPLDTPSLVGASTVADLLLLAWPSARPLARRAAVRPAVRAVLRARLDPAIVLSVAAVVLAVAGAVRLNNGLGGSVAVVAHVVEAAALGTALLRRGPRGRNAVSLYLVGTALLLGTSLRGWYITGHDIQNEYLSYLYTHDAGHWVMSVYPQPYNACLSVNIFPNVLVNMFGISGPFMFKVVAQLLFAVVPVCVYAASRRMLPRRTALLSGALFVFFPTFFTDMPFLVRQEVAYLFVALVVLAAFQPGWSTPVRRVASFVFGIGVVLSHYSTTYVMIITLLLGMLGVAAGTKFQAYRAPHLPTWRTKARYWLLTAPPRSGTKLAVLGPIVVVALIASAWLWSSPATHSDGHLGDTVSQLSKSLINGNLAAGSSDTKYSLLGGGGPTPQQRLDEYVAAAAQARTATPASSYVFPDPTGAIAHPQVVDRPYLPLTATGRVVQSAGLNVRMVNSLVRGATAAVFQIFLALGVLALMLRSRSTGRIGREQFWLMLASIGALGAVVVVPGLSADYGVLRAFQQTLLFAAPLLAVGVMTVLTRLGRAAFPVAVALTLGVGLVLTGAQPALFGGYYAQLSQSNSGQYYNLLYVDDPELSATHWLAGVTSGEGPETVTASDLVSVTRLQSMLPKSVGVSGEYLPFQLRSGAYVFMGPQTATHGQATIFYTGDLLTYAYPTKAVDAQLNLLYSTTGTRIYK